MSKRSDPCLFVGDETSTLTCTITAHKMDIPVAHVEAGLRGALRNFGMAERLKEKLSI